ncbi:hypothetical protein SAMN05216249_10277 [Acetitomaculum ruminis DSM 5522]|uniref:Catalase n=1 Tax=Acetitomaculum ruminis DSM 5522 TaxID=1120918 RepID=A0A1I0VLQ6_9FIRM|nr:DUF5662 family protein [Acetitomaculum ruminis]SFA77221.1 hypothetical protein SAMN05216249_10277 [Acetitomaculum ruminis DSM 5522]
MNVLGHLNTIVKHKKLVGEMCFRVGLYKQGLLHDLSKFSPVEFLVGCKYFYGDKSPNYGERLDKGYSSAWLHHKGRNKHHYEYWIDYSMKKGEVMAGSKMPFNYVAEMFIDRVAACKVYYKEKYEDKTPYDYYLLGKSKMVIHPVSQRQLKLLLEMLRDYGEDYTFDYLKRALKKYRRIQFKEALKKTFCKKNKKEDKKN